MKEVKIISSPVKPGYLTTEFYVTLVASALGGLPLALSDDCATQVAGTLVAGISAAAYSISRALSKR